MLQSRKRSSPDVGEKEVVKKAKFDKNPKESKVSRPVGSKPKKASSKTASGGKPPFTKGAKKSFEKKDEKTDWLKFKKDKKELKLKRKQTKDVYEISIGAKKIYEELKCHRTQNKADLVEKLYKLFGSGDTLSKMIMAHDTARIVQCMLKNATPAVHTLIAERMLSHAVEMSMSKYAHFCVLRMVKYGSASIKSRLVDSFMGNILKMSMHSLASKIVDNVYLNVANAQQQAFMRQEFYGELYRRSKDAKVKQLSDTYTTSDNMKASILSTVKANLERLANKQLIDNSLVHAIMLEYVNACDEQKMEETITTFAPLIPHMLTTKEGCQAAITCFYKAASKHRRAIIKAIKDHLVKICTHEQGHVFILALVNALDDTKATQKAIYEHIHGELETLMSNTWGRRVIEWFVAPADTNSFHPKFIATLDEGLQYSKKDKGTRRREVFEAVQKPIADAIVSNPEFWLSDRHIALVLTSILKKLNNEHFGNVAEALAKVVTNPKWSVTAESATADAPKVTKGQNVEEIIAAATKLKRQKQKKLKEADKEVETAEVDDDDDDDDDEKELDGVDKVLPQAAGIEDAGLHVVLKKIIKNDKERLLVQTESEEVPATFGAALVKNITPETLKYWLTVNRACFVLLNILENNNEATCGILKELLLPHKDTLQEQQKASGAQLLLKKLT